MKTITIPDLGRNPLTVKLNGKAYSYRVGETAEVPDEVAALIEDIQAAKIEPAAVGDKAPATIADVKRLIEEREKGIFETVAEYALGNEITGNQIQNGHLWMVTLSDEDAAAVFDAVGDGADLYFNSPDMPLEKPEGVEEQSESVILCNNATIEDGTITGLTEPGCAFGVMYSENTYVAEIVSTEDLSNRTVKILKKVSAPSGSDRLVVTLENVEYEEEGETRHKWQSDKSYTEIKAALDAKRDVEVLYPYDFDGAMTDPIFIHLYPIAYWEANHVISFSSVPTTFGDGLFTLAAGCTYESDETRWIIAQNEIAESKKFAFTATPDGQGGFTITPAAGVTYAAILESLGSTPLVFAVVSVPALNKTVIARFSAIDSGSTGVLTATVVEYLNGAYCVMALDVCEDGRTLVTVQPIPTQS